MKNDKKERTLYDAFKKSAETNREKTALIVEEQKDILKTFGLTEPLIRKMATDINNDLAAIDKEQTIIPSRSALKS